MKDFVLPFRDVICTVLRKFQGNKYINWPERKILIKNYYIRNLFILENLKLLHN